MISLRYWSHYLAIILVVNSLYEYCSSRIIGVSANFIESFNCSDSIYNVVDLAKISFIIPTSISKIKIIYLNKFDIHCTREIIR